MKTGMIHVALDTNDDRKLLDEVINEDENFFFFQNKQKPDLNKNRYSTTALERNVSVTEHE